MCVIMYVSLSHIYIYMCVFLNISRFTYLHIIMFFLAQKSPWPSAAPASVASLGAESPR